MSTMVKILQLDVLYLAFETCFVPVILLSYILRSKRFLRA